MWHGPPIGWKVLSVIVHNQKISWCSSVITEALGGCPRFYEQIQLLYTFSKSYNKSNHNHQLFESTCTVDLKITSCAWSLNPTWKGELGQLEWAVAPIASLRPFPDIQVRLYFEPRPISILMKYACCWQKRYCLVGLFGSKFMRQFIITSSGDD